MTKGSISDDIALRIALAARTLPETDTSRLIRVLVAAVGRPPTAERLAAIDLEDLKRAAGGELAELDPEALRAALAILKGEGTHAMDPPPSVESYAEGDMPGSIRVACASNGGEQLDGHFGTAPHFLIYQVSATENRLIDVRHPDGTKMVGDKNSERARLIRDCHLLYVASIGGPAAAKVVKQDIHPIKDAGGGSARGRMVALQGVLAGKAPPWLAKAMGQAPHERTRFEREGAEA